MSSFSKSPWIIHYDASSCNGCDIETLACLTPLFDVERLGVVNTGNPKHADIFVVTGAVNEQSREVIRNVYRQMPEPKVVVAVGICASTGGIFRECYNIAGGVDCVIPVDVYVPGCAARPEAIIDGVVQALGVLERRQQEMRTTGARLDEVMYSRAVKQDAAEILALEKIAFQTEAADAKDELAPVLQQNLEDVEDCFAARAERKTSFLDAHGAPMDPEKAPDEIVFLKAVVNGKIIGSIRAYASANTAFVSRCAVHPYFRDRGIGRRLFEEIETRFAQVKRIEAVVGHKSEESLGDLRRLGYAKCQANAATNSATWMCLQKERQ